MTSKNRSTKKARQLGVRFDRRGLRLEGGGVSFDGEGEGGVAFLSSALVVMAQGGPRVITSDLTARLLGARLGPALATPFFRPLLLGQLELELLPSGFVPGAAALSVRLEGKSLLYSGHLGRGAALLGLPPAAPRRCDHLVLRPIAAEPGFHCPPTEETICQVLEFAHRARRDGSVVLLHGHPLGPLQAAASPLQAAGFQVRAHRQVHRFFGPLRAAGVALGQVTRFEGEPVAGEVLLWPLERSLRLSGRREPPMARALLTGLRPSSELLAASGCEVSFPLGNELDFEALVAYVEACRPALVTFLGARPQALERALDDRGIRIEALGLPAQLPLGGLARGEAGLL